MRTILSNTLTRVPWRNGGGITREIASDHDAGGLLWRLSLADVEKEGAFSVWSGMARILTVITGPGMELETPDGKLEAKPLTPLHFSGDLSVTARVPDGPVQDLNLIYRSDSIAARLTFHDGPSRLKARTGGDGMQICFVLAGEVTVGDRSLPRHSTVFGPNRDLKLGERAKVLEIYMARSKVI